MMTRFPVMRTWSGRYANSHVVGDSDDVNLGDIVALDRSAQRADGEEGGDKDGGTHLVDLLRFDF